VSITKMSPQSLFIQVITTTSIKNVILFMIVSMHHLLRQVDYNQHNKLS